MSFKPPVTLLARLGEVTVFQTAASAQLAHLPHSQEQQVQNSEANEPSYGQFNLGLHVQDNPAKVLLNRLQLLTTINRQLHKQQQLPIERLHWVNQVHGKQVYDVDCSALSVCPVNADALVSQQPQLGLAIMTADCIPIVLYQPATGKIAAIHAGWQGLASGVIQAAIQHFSAVGQIQAWMGASISQANYEVGAQVRDKLLKGCLEQETLRSADIAKFDELFCLPSTPAASSLDSKVKLDLPKLARQQLRQAGITISGEMPPCSYADSQYYSYRRQTHLRQSATGRMALVIVRSLPS